MSYQKPFHKQRPQTVKITYSQYTQANAMRYDDPRSLLAALVLIARDNEDYNLLVAIQSTYIQLVKSVEDWENARAYHTSDPAADPPTNQERLTFDPFQGTLFAQDEST